MGTLVRPNTSVSEVGFLALVGFIRPLKMGKKVNTDKGDIIGNVLLGLSQCLGR